MPLKPHPTDPDKMVYVSRQYDLPKPNRKPAAWMNKHGACITTVFREVEAGAKEEYFIPLYEDELRKEMLDFIDEFTGAEQERHPMFSEGYDLALLHMKQLIEGRS
jgi:hypothetical protein